MLVSSDEGCVSSVLSIQVAGERNNGMHVFSTNQTLRCVA